MSTTTLRSLQNSLRDAMHEANIWAERVGQPNPSVRTVAGYESSKREVGRLLDLLKEERARQQALDAAHSSLGDKLRADIESTPLGQSRTAGTYVFLGNEAAGKSSRRLPWGTYEIEERSPLSKSSSGLAATGGVAGFIFAGMTETSGVLAADPEVLRTQDGNRIGIPTITDIGELPSGDRVAELGQISQTEPSFAQVEVGAYGYKMAMSASRELILDTAVDLDRFMGLHIGRLLGRYLGRDLILGTGSNMPLGIVPAIPVANKIAATTEAEGYPSSTSAKTDTDKAYDLLAKLPAELRDSAVFVMHPDSVTLLRKQKANNGLLLWPASDPLFCGHRYVTDSRITALSVGGDSAVTLAVFSPIAYIVRFVKQLRIEWVTKVGDAWDKDVVIIKAVLRADANALDTSAFAGMTRVAS